MDETQSTLLRELQKENKWWVDSQVPKELVRDFRRADFYAYSKSLIDNEYANIIIGPRRIGKSTVLYQLIDFLINEKKIRPNRVIFLSLARPFFGTVKDPIKQSLQLFEENILKESFESLSEPIYVFLDEASRNDGWALQLKEFFDRKYAIRFFVTGSSSPALFAKSSESLVGRHEPIIMLTLKFRDVIKLIGNKKANELLDTIRKAPLRDAFINAIKADSPQVFFDKLKDYYLSVGPEGETTLQIMLNQYLLRGGYPEFYDKNKDWVEASKIMREAYFDAIISYDMMRVFNSRNPEKIRQLYTFLAVYTAQQVNLSNLARDMGISKNALNDYLSQLQQTYLVRVMRPYKKNKLKIGNDIKKIYVGDIGLRNAVLGLTEEELNDSALLGRLAETAAQDHTIRLKFNLEPASICETFFWKSDKEVDVIVELNGKILPIESKYSEQIKSEDIQELRIAIEKNNSPFGILLTKKSFQYDKKSKIISLPLWLYLLMC